jgi:hypothetical protein
VGERHGQVDHDLDVIALEQLIDPHARHAKSGAAPFGRLAAHIGHSLEFKDGKALHRLEIGGTDHPAADYSDTDLSHSCCSVSRC